MPKDQRSEKHFKFTPEVDVVVGGQGFSYSPYLSTAQDG
jgi:hypothetical protein